MQLNDVYKNAEEKMNKAIAAVDHEFSGLRTGRASVALIDNVQVEAYGSRMPLKQVATISKPDARSLVIQPFDKNMMAAVEKSLLAANLLMTPNNDGKLIRLNIPPLTEERRKDLVKTIKQMSEEARVRIRSARRDTLDALKKAEKEGKITEDDLVSYEKEVQKLTDAFVKKIDESVAAKEADIMKV